MSVSLADQLKELGVRRGILIKAAEEGVIAELTCEMEPCRCPFGPRHFEQRPDPPSDWAPSVDHKILKKDGGRLELKNIRLAHVLCNRMGYMTRHGIEHDKDLARVASAPLKKKEAPEASGWTLGDLSEQLGEFESELRRKGLRENTINTYVDRTSLFLRWLGGDYQPQGPRG